MRSGCVKTGAGRRIRAEGILLKTGLSCSQGVCSFLSKSRAGGRCGWRGRQEPDHTGPGRLQ